MHDGHLTHLLAFHYHASCFNFVEGLPVAFLETVDGRVRRVDRQLDFIKLLTAMLSFMVWFLGNLALLLMHMPRAVSSNVAVARLFANIG
jgi:hypothetical protein